MICILKELKSAHQNDLGAFYKNRDNKRRLTVLAHEADDPAKNGDVFGDDILHKIVLRVKAEVAVFGKKSLDGGLVFEMCIRDRDSMAYRPRDSFSPLSSATRSTSSIASAK